MCMGGAATDGESRYAGFLSEVIVELSANNKGGCVAQASSVQDQEDDDALSPLPPLLFIFISVHYQEHHITRISGKE